MNVHELQMKFHQLREYTPENVNELLDFAKKAYIHNEIFQYRLSNSRS
nr:YppF family protein [Cytobacillus firmus]